MCLVTIVRFTQIFVVITPPALIYFSYLNTQYIITNDKTFLKKWDSLFYEFNNNKGLLSTQYYFVFFLRRLVYLLSLVTLNNFPESQATIHISLSVLSVVYLVVYMPYKDKILLYANIITETGIGLVNILVAIYIFDLSDDNLLNLDQSIFIVVALIMGLQTMASMLIFLRTIYSILKPKLVKIWQRKKVGNLKADTDSGADKTINFPDEEVSESIEIHND